MRRPWLGAVAIGVLLIGCGDDDGTDTNTNTNENDNQAGVCGDGELDAEEECDHGADNSDTTPDACRTDCRAAFCGDGVTDSGEECDDDVDNSDTVPDACRTDCRAAFCGDGVTDSGEECDDDVDNSDTTPDACRTDCTAARCGDGVVDSDEQCDASNLSGQDCSDHGFDTGTLACDGNCELDESACKDCAGDELLCGAECIQPLSDDDHCGGCTTVCAAGEACVGGSCEGISQSWVAHGDQPVGAAYHIRGHDLTAHEGYPLVAMVYEGGLGDVVSVYRKRPNDSVWTHLGGAGASVASAHNLSDAVALATTGTYVFVGYGTEESNQLALEVSAADANLGYSWVVRATGYVSTCTVLWDMDLALDAQSQPHLVYYGSGGCGLGVGYVWYDSSSSLWQSRPSPVGMPSLITDDGEGRPAVVYTDQAYVGLAESSMSNPTDHSVRYWDGGGSQWATLGGALDENNQSGGVEDLDLDLDLVASETGEIYAAWSELRAGGGQDVYVKAWDPVGQSWTMLGGGPVSATGSQTEPSLALVAGVPWVAYLEQGSSTAKLVSVRRFDASAGSWTAVGGALNQDATEDGIAPVITGLEGVPYVAWRELDGTEDRVFVKRFP